MKDSILYYSVGPLLYCPANHKSLANSLIHERFGRHFSLAVCLEDTIQDDRIAEAEHELVQTIHTLFNEKKKHLFFLPKIFIRVRSPQQIPDLMERFGDAGVLITGFIIPKFSLENADSYISEILSVNERYNRAIYMMPIFESPSMIHLQHRHQILYTLKEKLDAIEPLVLNIRVGGNDLCHVFRLSPPRHPVDPRYPSDLRYFFRYHYRVWHGLCNFRSGLGILQRLRLGQWFKSGTGTGQALWIYRKNRDPSKPDSSGQ